MRIRRSLTIKQMATVSGVALVTICLFIVIQLFHFVQQRREDYTLQLQNIASSVRQSLSNAVLKADIPQEEQILVTLKRSGILSRADVVLPNDVQVLHDDVCVTNINRQIHALRDRVGQPKIAVMAERLAAINPECRVTAIDDFITADNVAQRLNGGFDYVIDAIDSVRAKAALLAYCRRYKIPVVCVGAAGGQTDPTRIQVVDLAKTIQDPLAAKVRDRLKQKFQVVKNSKGKLGIDCVFSSEQLVYPQLDGSVCASPSTAGGAKRMDCASGFGAATMVTATFGFVAVAHALKKMLTKARRQHATPPLA